jgi:hypothetical protein
LVCGYQARRRHIPNVTLPTSPLRRVRAGRLFTAALCKSRRVWGKRSIGLAPDYQLQRDELLLRRKTALQLCVHVGREEGLSWR